MSKRSMISSAVAAAALLAMGSVSMGQTTFTWDGGGLNANINTVANYVSNTYSANAANFFVFSDGSVRNAVTGNNNPVGQLTFGGDAFTFNLTATLDLSPSVATTSIVMDSNNLITFSGAGQLTMRKGVSGTGTGIIAVSSNFGLTSNAYTWDGAGIFLMNDANGTTVTGANRLMTFGGTQKMIVNNSMGSGLGQFGINATGTSSLAGSVLGGSGFLTPGDSTTNANITIANFGTLSPGDNFTPAADVGTLTTTFGNTAGKMILSSGSKYVFDLATTAPGASDQIVLMNGTLQLNGQQFADFTFNNLAGFGAGTYTLFDATTITGSLGASVAGTIGGLGSTLSVSGNDVILTVVPEPATLSLLAGTAIGLLARRRRA